MIKPELFDVVEFLVDLPDLEIKAGELGTIVEEHNGRAYELMLRRSLKRFQGLPFQVRLL